MTDEIRRYVPACLKRISPPHWARARRAKSIRQAYRIVKEMEHRLPFPWPEPIEAVGLGRRERVQDPVEFQRQDAWTVEEARERARLKAETIENFYSPRPAQPPPKVERVRVEPKDIKVVRVTPPPRARVEPMDGAEWELGWNHSPGGGRWRHLNKCYIGDVMEDGTYQYGPHNQPSWAKGPASEATAETSAEFYARNEQDFEKWEEVCDA